MFYIHIYFAWPKWEFCMDTAGYNAGLDIYADSILWILSLALHMSLSVFLPFLSLPLSLDRWIALMPQSVVFCSVELACLHLDCSVLIVALSFFFSLLCLFWPFNCLRWWYCMVWLCMNVVPWLFSFTVGMFKTIWHLNLLLYVQTFVLIYICIVRIALNECPNMNCNDNKRYPLSNMIQSIGNACGHWKLLWTKLFFSFEL